MKFKMPHAFSIIFVLIIVVAALTWILPAGKFDTKMDTVTGKELVVAGTYKTVDQDPQGLKSILTSFSKGIIEASEVIAFVLLVGGAYGVIIKSGAIESGLNQAIKKFGNKATLIIPVLMFLFSLGGTTTGMWEETLPFFMITVPLMVALGYDPLVGIALIIVGAGSGTLGSTVNPFASGLASAIAGISIKDGFSLRVLLYVLSVGASISYVMWYAMRIKKDPKKSVVYNLRALHIESFLNNKKSSNQAVDTSEFQTSHKIILAIFFATILFMVYSIICLGWWMGEITMLFLIVAIIAGVLSKMDDTSFWESFIEGSKDLLSAALVIGLARGIVVVANDGMILDTILNASASFLSDFSKMTFIAFNEIIQIFLAFLVPSSSGQAALTMPIMAPLADLLNIPKSSIVTAFQCASGIVNLITPTSGVLMAAIAIAKVSWADWIKFMIPLLIIQLVIIFVILFISVA